MKKLLVLLVIFSLITINSVQAEDLMYYGQSNEYGYSFHEGKRKIGALTLQAKNGQVIYRYGKKKMTLKTDRIIVSRLQGYFLEKLDRETPFSYQYYYQIKKINFKTGQQTTLYEGLSEDQGVLLEMKYKQNLYLLNLPMQSENYGYMVFDSKTKKMAYRSFQYVNHPLAFYKQYFVTRREEHELILGQIVHNKDQLIRVLTTKSASDQTAFVKGSIYYFTRARQGQKMRIKLIKETLKGTKKTMKTFKNVEDFRVISFDAHNMKVQVNAKTKYLAY